MADERPIRSERAERGVAQYQRLASLLRHRIAKGEYPLGTQLPPITQLADDRGVAVVTVRQAYELLSKEGLIRSQRGVGTHVAALPAATGDLELAINDPFAAHGLIPPPEGRWFGAPTRPGRALRGALPSGEGKRASGLA
jgi:GntR family transcriptional regulator